MAVIRSTTGEAEFKIEPLEKSEFKTKTHLCRITLSASTWDGDHDQPFEFSATGIWLLEKPILDLSDRILAWVELPLQKLSGRKLAGKYELASKPYRVCIEIRPGYDVPEQNVLLKLSVSVAPLGLVFALQADPSCLASFASEVRKDLGM